MAKYSFAQIGPEKFESMIKALIEQRYRTTGHLIQFGPGKDGAREATWSQPQSHNGYIPPKDLSSRSRKWVFQVKYHDTVRTRTRHPSTELATDLKTELEKLTIKYGTKCDTYVLITNLPLSGVHAIGGRDRIEVVAAKWRQKLDVEVWDEATLSAMIDANVDVRTTYLEEILPGDILASLLQQTKKTENRHRAIVRTYLTKILRRNGLARAATDLGCAGGGV